MSKPITIFFKRNSRAAINAQLAEMNELIEKGYRFKVTNDRKSCVVLFPIPRFVMEIPGEESEEDEVVSEEVSQEPVSEVVFSDLSEESIEEIQKLVEQPLEDTSEEAQPVEGVSTTAALDVDALLAELEELSGMKEIVDAFVKKVGVEIPADKIHPNAKKKWLKEYLTSLKG